MYSEKTQSSSHYEADSDAEGIIEVKLPPSRSRELVDILEKDEEIYEVDFDDCSSSDEEIKQKVKSAERRGIAVRSSKNRTRYEINDGRYPKAPDTSYFDHDHQLPTQIFEKSVISTKNLLVGCFCLVLLATVLGALVSIFGFSKILVNSSHNNYGYDVDIGGNKDVNITQFYSNSSISVSLVPKCSYTYSCPLECTPELDSFLSCCYGCNQGPQGECGLNVTVKYNNIPRTNITNPPLIYILATTDGVHFWQTGSPLYVIGFPNSGGGGGGGISFGEMEFTNNSGTITNGCYGKPRSIAILGCLSLYNLTGVQFNAGIPENTCLVLGGSCPKLNYVWQRSVVGCIGEVWVGSPGFKLSYSVPLILLGLFVTLLSWLPSYCN